MTDIIEKALIFIVTILIGTVLGNCMAESFLVKGASKSARIRVSLIITIILFLIIILFPSEETLNRILNI